MKMNWFLFVGVVILSLLGMHVYRQSQLGNTQIVITSLVVILVIGQFAYLVGKRKKQSQMIDEKRLKERGVTKKDAKFVSFLEQALTSGSKGNLS